MTQAPQDVTQDTIMAHDPDNAHAEQMTRDRAAWKLYRRIHGEPCAGELRRLAFEAEVKADYARLRPPQVVQPPPEVIDLQTWGTRGQDHDREHDASLVEEVNK